MQRIAIMLQHSKLLRSRRDWKQKATQRAYEVRELKKTEKRLKTKIAELKESHQDNKKLIEPGKKNR